MRLFVTAWPSDEVRDLVAGVPRPADPAVRWTTRDQWHVTLAFVGEVGEEQVDALVGAVGAAAGACPVRPVTMGPATRRFGKGQLVVPVAGLDDLAEAVGERTTAALGRPPEARPFRGHLTLARSRGKQTIPPALEGMPLVATWTVDAVALVRSHLGAGPARYETLASAPLAPDPNSRP
jgi:RNA 2',3'-cyclic 3'-phosphodiesterase